MTRAYADVFYESPDGLTLYARDYAGQDDRPVLLCMHGLTRNSADFEPLADLLPEYRMIAVDQRGRGRSDYDRDKERYRPDVYCSDMFALIAHLNLSNIVSIGTSMGGLMSLIMAALKPGVFTGAVINDIGPDIAPEGIDRLRGYVGAKMEFENWDEAAAAIKAQGETIFPEFDDADFLTFARRTCREEGDKVIFMYDPAIAKGLSESDPSAAPPDMWPLFGALLATPTLLIRGANSDILSDDTAQKMQAGHPLLRRVDVPNRGHAPILDEPVARDAISAFLERFHA